MAVGDAADGALPSETANLSTLNPTPATRAAAEPVEEIHFPVMMSQYWPLLGAVLPTPPPSMNTNGVAPSMAKVCHDALSTAFAELAVAVALSLTNCPAAIVLVEFVVSLVTHVL